MSDTKTPVTNDLNKLFDKIKDVRMAMLTTFDEQNNLHSRPMATIKPRKDGDGSLLFLTDANSAKVYELKQRQQSEPELRRPRRPTCTCRYRARANAYRDAAKAAELYTEPMRAWFPKGKDDPNIMILKVTIDPGRVLGHAQQRARARPLATPAPW